MNKIKQNWSLVLLLLFIVVTWCYWRFEFPALMVFREQIQMFLFNGAYFADRIIYPAGLARYVAEFLVQFFNNLSLGALVIALLAAALQYVTKVICNASTENIPAKKIANDYLAYIPVLMLLYFLGNENVNFTFPVAILFVLLGICGYIALKSKTQRWIYAIVAIPVFYWISGPVVLMLPVYIAFAEIRRKEKILPVFAIVYAITLILVSALFVKAPLYRIWYGLNYSIVINEILPLQIAIPCIFALLPVVAYYFPEIGAKRISTVNVVSTLVIFAVVAFLLPKGVEKVRYEIFEYDYLVRANNWDAIIHKAEKKQPQTPLSVASLNLALAMEGQLVDRGTQFFQNGPQGAFPLFNKNFLFSLMTSEVYFHVGLINTAQRYVFEAQETIPDNNKSSRIMKRLVETNIINGNYDVARKYINLLKQTMFYRQWAQRQEKLLGDEKAIEADPLYGHMRQVRLKVDFIFSESEVDKIMGQLIITNPKNTVAQQYLLFIPILEGNQQKYLMYKDFLDKIYSGEIKTDSLTLGQAKPSPDAANVRVDGYTSASPQAR